MIGSSGLRPCGARLNLKIGTSSLPSVRDEHVTVPEAGEARET